MSFYEEYMTRVDSGETASESVRLVPVVFDMESDRGPTPIGTYARSVEDTVDYLRPDGTIGTAPQDCVRVVVVEFSERESAIADAFTPPDPFSRKA